MLFTWPLIPWAEPAICELYERRAICAEAHDADPQRVSAAILRSMLVGVVSFPCVASPALE